MSVPRPKPWEVSAGTSLAMTEGNNTEVNHVTEIANAPDLPARPVGLGNAGYSGYSNGYNNGYSNGYNQYSSPYSSYSSPYSSYGSYGMGSYGMGMGMGSYGMSPYNRFGTGMHGPPTALQTSTAATFQLLEGIVGAVGGFAQMLESTYMATHSSFFAMVSVAEQLGNLKTSLGSVLGVFAVLRWVRKILGRGKDKSEMVDEFHQFTKKPRPSYKPLLFFLAAIFGFPYLMSRLIRSLSPREMDPEVLVDPSTLEFCRAIYAFVPENPGIELEMRRGDLLAVIAKKDAQGAESMWWRVRTKDGRTGYVPSNYVQVVEREVS